VNSDNLAEFKALLERELAQLDLSYRGAEAVAVYGGYHEAASVLSTFDPDDLQPSGIFEPEPHIEALLANSSLVTDPEGKSRWTLNPSVRSEVLRQLGTRENMLRALAANPKRPQTILQQMFDAYIQGNAPALEQQSLTQLTATFQVCDWLRPVLSVPDRTAITRRIDYAGLLQPLEDLAGEHFSGRRNELARLRAYVDVLPPDSTLGAVRRWIERGVKEILSLHERPPLLVYGPGGMGKSTLLARLILEHARLDDSQRIPFVYLDFDRAELREDEPLTLLIEAVRQLGLQYAHAYEACERIRADWQRRLVEILQRRSISADGELRTAPVDLTPFLAGFADLLATLDLRGKPILFALDTFEEIQWRSAAGVQTLMTFLTDLQARVPRLRVVIAGRAPVPNYDTDDLQLAELDSEAAQAYLRKKGISDPKVAAEVAARLGGNPMTLRLAAEVVAKEGVAALDTGGLDQLSVQRHLFRRILGRLHDPDLRKLAHPGLVLRRITSELIIEVLAEPCEIAVPDSQTAMRLFDGLKREVALVMPAEGDAVRLRPELRRIMLPLLERDKPTVVAEIHRRAVRYYEARNAPIDRAEEIYHRLSLHEAAATIDTRWMPGVEPFLSNAIDDLPPAERAYLASRLGVALDAAALSAAATTDWERDAERRMRDWLAHGKPQDAVAVVAERPERQPGTVIDALHATALEQLGRTAEAVAVLERAIPPAPPELQSELLLAAARAHLRLRNSTGASFALDQASALTSTRGPLFQLEIVVLRIQAAAMNGDDRRRSEAVGNLRSLIGSMGDSELAREPALLRQVAAQLDARDSAILARLVRILGLETITPAQRRSLSIALASWDTEASRAADDRPGVIARSVGLPPREKLSDSWAVLRSGEPRLVAALVAAVLEKYPLESGDPAAARAVLRAVVGVLAPESSAGHTDSPEAAAAASAVSRVRLTERQTLDLVNAVVSAFPRLEQLEAFLSFRFDRNLAAITTLTKPLVAMTADVVADAQAKGWVVDLVAAARDAAPANPQLQALATEFGIGSATTADLSGLERVIQASQPLDINAWRGRLGLLEGQVCRIEVSQADGRTRYFGTGFLVAPDLVLTAYHVVEPAIANRSAEAVVCRFDFKRIAEGRTLNAGTEVRLSPREWLVSGAKDLDFALLRLDGFPGAEPIGGGRAELDAPRRGWIDLPTEDYRFTANSPLFILQHPQAEPLKLAMEMNGVVRVSADGTRLAHRVHTLAGSAGSPVFGPDLKLVAMHHATEQRSGEVAGEAITIGAIVATLQRAGVFRLLGGRGLA
jgi:hypothetical protein